jgi:acetylornithine deacetylase/succinyl-diaminopimelate desuccinylase-like protein
LRDPDGDSVAISRDGKRVGVMECRLGVPDDGWMGFPFVVILGLSTADIGIGYLEARIHAPDENIRTEDFRRGAKAVAALLERFAEG